MAKKRPSTQKRQREYMKRQRELEKAEKAAQKRERRLSGEAPEDSPPADDADDSRNSDGENSVAGE